MADGFTESDRADSFSCIDSNDIGHFADLGSQPDPEASERTETSGVCQNGSSVPALSADDSLATRDEGYPETEVDAMSYCVDHDRLGFSACTSPGHEEYDIIGAPMSWQKLENSLEHGNLIWYLDQLREKSSKLQTYAETGIIRVNDQYARALQDFACFRQQIIDALDKLGNSIKTKAEKIKATDIENMNIVQKNSHKAKEALELLTIQLEEAIARSQNNELAAQMVKTNASLEHIDTELTELEAKTVTDYTFVGHDLQDLVTMVTDSGKLRVVPKERKYVPAYDITLKSDQVANDCSIPSLVMVPHNKLVIATSDKKLCGIKVIDTVHEVVVQEISMPSRPWDMARFQGDRLAVTQTEERRIAFLLFSSTNAMQVEREMYLSGQCYGVASLNDNLVVTFKNPAKVVIMDMLGNILRSFYKDSEGKNLFSFPCNVAVSADGMSIYVSDCSKHTVTSLALDGRVQAIYASDSLKRPRKIYTDACGTVYVCGQASNNIHVLSPALEKLKVLQIGAVPKLFGVIKLFELDVPGPLSIHVCEKTDKLYVGMYKQNKVRVFQLV